MLEKKDLEMISEVVSEIIKPLDTKLNKVESKVTEIQMTLENETNKQIAIIAEGHLDLSRKLDDEVRRIKARIEGIA